MPEQSAPLAPLHYTLIPGAPHAHEFTVTLTVTDPDPAGQRFSLPVWIPGSYMVREFARHIVSIRAESAGQPVTLVKPDKQTWQAAPVATPLTLTYCVYAWDLSVRGAHLDATHAFFNGTSVFLCPEGKADRRCLLDLQPPPAAIATNWQVATSLPCATGEPEAAVSWGFGRYQAENYDALIDHPVEMGTFTRAEFVAGGVPHAVVLTGRHDADLARLSGDLQRICQWQIDFFAGQPNAAAPVSRYLFLVMAVDEGYGGLEHRASTALLCSRNDLPHAGTPKDALPDGYLSFLGLCSHEYFHTWNIKRIKPAAFTPYDLSRENHTRLLWAFEGITSYYDDLALLRCGLIDLPRYLGLIAKTVSTVHKVPGHQVQSVAESSFDAWIKYYRPDENTPNVVVSYYTKGALIALLLDLRLRQHASGLSLDTLMREMWQRYGQDDGAGNSSGGVPESGWYTLVAEQAGDDLAQWLRGLVEGRGSLVQALTEALSGFGIRLDWQPASTTPDTGAKLEGKGREVRVVQVYRDGPAMQAGLAAGDVIIACNGLRVGLKRLEQLLQRQPAGHPVELHVFRRDELMTCHLTPVAPRADKAVLTAAPALTAPTATDRTQWPWHLSCLPPEASPA